MQQNNEEKVWKDAIKEPLLKAIAEFEKGGWHITDIDKCRNFIKQIKIINNL